MKPRERRPAFEILEELSESVRASEAPRETALYVLGFAMGIALRAGWTLTELFPSLAKEDEKKS
jgi:hypothetical protein